MAREEEACYDDCSQDHGSDEEDAQTLALPDLGCVSVDIEVEEEEEETDECACARYAREGEIAPEEACFLHFLDGFRGC